MELKTFTMVPNLARTRAVIKINAEIVGEEVIWREKAMAIKSVRVKINGLWTNLTQDKTGKWTGNITAPAATSYNLPTGHYPVLIEAVNDAGTVKTWETTDTEWGDALKLVVRETIKPVITIVSPSDGSYVTNNQQTISFRVIDEAGGSGVDLSTIKLKIDGTVYGSEEGVTYTELLNGYQCSFTPQIAMEDGQHTIVVNASDHDGNVAMAKSSTITVDTVPPALTVSSPAADLITNHNVLTIEGMTNAETSSPVEVQITLNDGDQGSVLVGSDGSFTKTVTLTEGVNIITVTATDTSGKTSTITNMVSLDTSIPKIQSLSIAPSPVNASANLTIAVEVE